MSGLFGAKTKAAGQSPAVGALNVQQSSYGTPIALVYGTNRINGNLIWYDDFRSEQVSSGGGAGKGGGGGGGGSSSWNYFTSFMVGLCEGPIDHIGRVWENKNVTDVPTLGGTVSIGSLGQSPWGYLTTNHPDKALSYSKLAHVDFANYALGTSTSTPNLAFEVFASPDGSTPSGQDTWPAAFVSDFLARSAWPTSYLDTLAGSSFDSYTQAMSLGISPVLTEQDTAASTLKSIMTTLNSEFVWTGGILKIIPYGDVSASGNGATYTPNLTPVYDLTNDDFIVDGDEDPITVDRVNLADAYNQQPVEFYNLNNSYNVETYTAEDAGHIDMFGVRTASTLSAHHITSPDIAQLVAYAVLWRQLFVRTKYQFKLGWKHILLEPMDYVTLTQAALEFDRVLVRITDITEDENGMLTITAEEAPGNLAQAAIYTSSQANRYAANYNSDPGDTNAPIIFEAPLALNQAAALEVWMAISGADANWGGCNIWISSDGNTYAYLDKFEAKSRQGILTSDLPTYSPAGQNNIDQTNMLAISMTESGGTLNNSAVSADAVNLNTICYVDGELIAYGNDALIGLNAYNLSYLNRGCYGSAISAHPSGSAFARLDQAIFKYTADQNRIGQTIYLKFTSFNLYGAGHQTLSDVPAYSYAVTGAALMTPLGNPSALALNYRDKIAQLTWTAVTDLRAPILYEIRQGATFANSQIVTRTTNIWIPVQGSGTYWVSALYFTPLGNAVYSASPPSLAVTIPALIDNVLASYDEAATSWGGTCSGGAIVDGSNIVLQSSGNILDLTNVLAESSILYLGGLTGSGIYTPPSGHTIISACVINAKITANWSLFGQSVFDNVLSNPDVLATDDILGQQFQAFVYAQPQIRTSLDGTTWSAWQNWQPGVYTFLQAQMRIVIYSSNVNVQAVLAAFSFEADAPSLTYTGQSTSSASTTVSVSYPATFNATPLPQITIQNAQQGDDVVLTAQSSSGFTYKILNSGVQVVRTVNWSITAF